MNRPTNDPLANMDPDVALGIRMWAHYDATLRMTGDARIAYSTLGVAVRAHASALEAASEKPTVERPLTATEEMYLATRDAKPAAYYGGVPIYETTDPAFAGKGLVAIQPAPAQPACEPSRDVWTNSFSEALGKPAPRGGGDEGLEEEADMLAKAKYPECSLNAIYYSERCHEEWRNVARAARSLRAKGGVSHAMQTVHEALGKFSTSEFRSKGLPGDPTYEAWETAKKEIAALDSGASVVVDREEIDGLRKDVADANRFLREARADAERLKGERDEARAMLDGLQSQWDSVRETVCAAIGDWDASTGDALERIIARIRTLPATVSVTRIEEAAEELCAANYPGGIDSEDALAILRKHTATADVEGLIAAMFDDADGNATVSITLHDMRVYAKRALAHLGVDAKPAEPRAGFVVDREKVNAVARERHSAWIRGQAMLNATLGEACADAAVAEYERQQAEWQKGGAS